MAGPDQAACRLHAVLCEITPGRVPQVTTANRAAAILTAHAPATAVAAAWHELAREHLADLRRLDAHRRDIRAKLAAAVRASGTTVTDVFGVGPVNAAAIIGDAGDAARFPTAGRFASDNGTAPIEVSSGKRKTYRLSQRGNRHLNHAIHMAAVTQIAHRHKRSGRAGAELAAHQVRRPGRGGVRAGNAVPAAAAAAGQPEVAHQPLHRAPRHGVPCRFRASQTFRAPYTP